MDKKEIFILVALLLVTALSLYRRYAARKKKEGGPQGVMRQKGDSLTGQPDDYKPYSEKK